MVIMETKDNVIDGLEVFVKVMIGISLNEEEIQIYNSYDETEKKIIFDFINNPVFANELDRIVKKINDKNVKQKEKIK